QVEREALSRQDRPRGAFDRPEPRPGLDRVTVGGGPGERDLRFEGGEDALGDGEAGEHAVLFREEVGFGLPVRRYRRQRRHVARPDVLGEGARDEVVDGREVGRAHAEAKVSRTISGAGIGRLRAVSTKQRTTVPVTSTV